MKKQFSIVAIALMAFVVAFGSCKKDPKPEPTPAAPTYAKTQVSAQVCFSQDFQEFFNIDYSVIDFQGTETQMPLNDTVSKLFETTEKNGSMKTMIMITPKEELPEIDPEKEYRFEFKASALAGIMNSVGDFSVVKTVALTEILAGVTMCVNGDHMTPENIARIQNTFGDKGKTVTFKVTNGEELTVE